jgi:hypothetical protein
LTLGVCWALLSAQAASADRQVASSGQTVAEFWFDQPGEYE